METVVVARDAYFAICCLGCDHWCCCYSITSGDGP